MIYALDLITGLLCVVVAFPLLMQLRRSPKYRRYLDGQGKPIDPKAMVRDGMQGDGTVTIEIAFEDLREEVFITRMKDEPMPEGDGWWLDEDSEKTYRHYLNAAFGTLLATTALCLIFALPVPGRYLAWAVFAAAATLVAVDVRRLAVLIGKQDFHPLNFIFVGLALFGAAAALRLY